MPILKELTVQHITREYLSSWAVPGNVGMQVRTERGAERKKNGPIEVNAIKMVKAKCNT